MRFLAIVIGIFSLKFSDLRPYSSRANRISGLDLRSGNEVPPVPSPEPITVTELPLPPVINVDAGVSCDEINPSGTGCISKSPALASGNFLPDGNHVVVALNFTGAPDSPDPASIYSGRHLVLIKADGTKFPTGDAWRCITCGVPTANLFGDEDVMDYPQAFADGKRILSGANIYSSQVELTSQDFSPKSLYRIPIHWTVTNNNTRGTMREVRIHPDNIHLAWSSPSVQNGVFEQFSYYGRLELIKIAEGTAIVYRYQLNDVHLLYKQDDIQSIEMDPNDNSRLVFHPEAINIGEIRGFSGSGNEISYIGYSRESSNIDVFAVDLRTGIIRRLTAHPEYCDPVDISPDDKWHVVMDTRGTDRQMFMAGLRGIPPLTDIVSTSAASSTRNNGARRFFQPYIIDHYGDRGDYFGQKVNSDGDGRPGGGDINDPEWNGKADPKWSFDGTKIVYYQSFTEYPSCGGPNPLPCYPSTADGGRMDRLMIARLTDRSPLNLNPVKPGPDSIPWGTPYSPGDVISTRPYPLAGTYTLDGNHSGYANVTITENELGTISSVAVQYYEFSDDGENVLRGNEKVSRQNPQPTLEFIDWYSDLTQEGPWNGTKKTSKDGFQLLIDIMVNNFEANGTLTTTINGKEYKQPANGT